MMHTRAIRMRRRRPHRMAPVYKHHITTKLVVRNLAPNMTVDKVNDIFKDYGAMRSVRLMTDVMTGRCSGVAFVALDEHVAGHAASALDGSCQYGRVIRVGIERKTDRTVGRAEREAGG